MSAGDRDTLALAELLAAHDRYAWVGTEGFRCECAEPLGDSYPDPAHRAHVADVLLASDWLREQRAEAWKEGRDHGRDNSRDGFCLCTDDGWARSDECLNPYRRLTENPDAD